MNETAFQQFLDDRRRIVLEKWACDQGVKVFENVPLDNLQTYCRNKGLSEMNERILFTRELERFNALASAAFSHREPIESYRARTIN